MTQKLKRYDIDEDGTGCPYISEQISGDYVKFEDYQKLQEQLGKAEAILKDLSLEHKSEEELVENTELTSESGGGNEDDCFMYGYLQADSCTALKARQYFKEKENQ